MTKIFSLIVLSGLLAVQAQAATRVYVTMKGRTSGPILGDVTTPGHKDAILATDFSYQLSLPYDVATGHASGKRQHKPVRIVKDIDRASPQLMTCAANNETLTDVELAFFEPDAAGREAETYKVQLQNAIITEFSQSLGTLPGEAANGALHLLETVEFTFQKIVITDVKTGKSAVDDWTQ